MLNHIATTEELHRNQEAPGHVTVILLFRELFVKTVCLAYHYFFFTCETLMYAFSCFTVTSITKKIRARSMK